MISGIPVLAMKKGALPEIVVDRDTGFLVSSLEGMVASVERLDTIDWHACRRHTQQNFSVARWFKITLTFIGKLVRNTNLGAIP